MGSTRLCVEQIARGVNDISKANLGEDWRFGKAPYSQSNPTPQVSVWSSYFSAVHLLIRPDATREILLNAIRHPYGPRRRWSQWRRRSPWLMAGRRRPSPTPALGVARASLVFFFMCLELLIVARNGRC